MSKIKFIEKRFPEDISYGSSGGPCYSTDVISMVSGHEQRNINWQQSKARYNVATGIKSEEQLQALVAFFRVCKGRAIGFRFKDWGDYQGRKQLIALGDGKQKTFQLVKRYESAGIQEIRKITKPVLGSVKVAVADNKVRTLDINYTNGFITLPQAPKAGVKVVASFEFDVPARFDTDSLMASIEGYQTHSMAEIPIVEIRV